MTNIAPEAPTREPISAVRKRLKLREAIRLLLLGAFDGLAMLLLRTSGPKTKIGVMRLDAIGDYVVWQT